MLLIVKGPGKRKHEEIGTACRVYLEDVGSFKKLENFRLRGSGNSTRSRE